jgi:hypothetical protein
MNVECLDDDFLNECYGLNLEWPEIEIPKEFLWSVPNFPITTNEDEDYDEFLRKYYVPEKDINELLDFKDFSYSFEIYYKNGDTRLFATISNQDFWFNFHINESILTINESEITIVKYIDILQDSTIKEFFIKNLTDEIERLDQLELFDSFNELIKLQQLFKRFESNFWCKEILLLSETINLKVAEKIDHFGNEHKLIKKIMIINRTDNEEKHLKRLRLSLLPLCDHELKSLFHSIKSLFGLKRNAGDGEIHFFKLVSPGYYCVALKITLYQFEKLINCISNNRPLKFSPDSIGNVTVKRIDKPSIIPVDIKLFSKELFHLVNVTTETGNKFNEEEIDNLCQIIVNAKKFNASKTEIDKFNNWLDDKSNLILFQVFLSYICSNSIKMIKHRSYQKLSESISSKFARRGLGKSNLLKKYINSNELNFILNDSNKSDIAFVHSKIITAEKKLKNGIVKKMLKQILSNC